MNSVGNNFLSLGFLLAMVVIVIVACEPAAQSPDSNFNSDDFRIALSAERTSGNAQFEFNAETSDSVNIDIQVESPAPLEGLQILKTKNLEADSSFGSNGVKTIEPSGTSFEHEFTYIPDTTDLDPLVGFTFEATNVDRDTAISDLTLNVDLSPRDNITLVRWDLQALIHVNQDNEDITEDCHEGYALLLNADSTMSRPLGDQSCGVDELNVFDKWYFTDNDEKIIMERHNIFSPNETVIDTFKVEKLTLNEMSLEQTVDLTELGEGVETYLYKYKSNQR